MAKKITPLMKQYNAIKAKYPDALLLFRIGDFYETFGEDAIKAAGILNITLTARNNGGNGEKIELAGFPHHSLNTYLPKLVMAGCRVAICDQLEDPKQTKKIVKRGVTELITPGVALNDDILNAKSNNFLAAIHFGTSAGSANKKEEIGISFLDVSTGEFLTSQGSAEYIDKLLQNFSPSEVLFSKQKRKLFSEYFGDNYHVFHLEDWVFQTDYATETLNNHFKTTSLKGFGISHLTSGIISSGAALHYLSETRHNKLQHIAKISRIAEDAYVWMDRFTIGNLELYHSTSQNAVTLLDVIDTTISPMGGRLLKRWVALPLKNKDKITSRHEVVSYLLDQPIVLDKIQQNIKRIGDLERLISKVATGKVSPREVIHLKNSLEAIVPIKAQAQEANNESIKIIGDQLM
jgi:DNA mismatch repair protein MutS